MGRIYNGFKKMYEKAKQTGNYDEYQNVIDKFVLLLTYDDSYLMKLQNMRPVIEMDENILINCGGYGICITQKDEISIHT